MEMNIEQNTGKAHAWIASKAHWLLSLYLKIQVYNKGSYTIERLPSFKEYCEKASFHRVLFVCLLTPLPALIASIGIDMIPLASPLEAWNDNYTLWIRYLILATFISTGFTLQILTLLPSLKITRWCVLVLVLGTSSATTSVYMLAAALWTFPIPFGIVFIAFPFTCIYILLLMAVSDWKIVRKSPEEMKSLWRVTYVFAFHVYTLVVYVAFNAMFQSLTASQQVFAVPLLPLVKLHLKNMYARVLSHKREAIPEFTVFCVEVFNALFVSICMQTANSIATTIVIISIDATQIIFSLLEMQEDSKTLLAEIKRCKIKRASQKNLLASVLELSNQSTVRKFSLLDETKSKCDVREARTTSFGSAKSGPSTPNTPETQVKAKSNQVVAYQQDLPADLDKKKGAHQSLANDFASEMVEIHADRAREDDVVDEALKLLFHIEYCLLSEYCEVILPILYLSYLIILHYLPNVVYYEHSSHLTGKELLLVVMNLSVFILMELLSLVVLHYLLKSRFNFSPVHQLAYVLEDENRQIQGHLILFVTYVLGFTLMHYGVDFGFKFNWAEQVASDITDSP